MKPRLTAKVVRGMEWICNHAAADLEAAMDDEIPSLTTHEAEDARAALVYLDALRSWHAGRAARPTESDYADRYGDGFYE